MKKLLDSDWLRTVQFFQIFPPLVFSYRLFIFTNRGNFQVRTKEGIGQESNGAANQEKQIFLLCRISPSASSTRDLGTRLHPSRKFFHVYNVLLISNHTVFLVQFWINLQDWIFQKAKLHSPKRLVQFQLFEPNWTRNRMITYTKRPSTSFAS